MSISLAGAPSVVGQPSYYGKNTWNAIVTGQAYGDCIYSVTASSSYGPNSAAWMIFDYTTRTAFCAHWGYYNYNNGNWAFGPSSSYTLDGVYFGDWVTIELPEAILLTRSQLISRADNSARAPRLFRVYGSNDCNAWTLLHEQADSLLNDPSGTAEFSISSSQKYTCFGLVVSALSSGGDVMNFANWKLFAGSLVRDTLIIAFACQSFKRF
jgi:hypothetical protein